MIKNKTSLWKSFRVAILLMVLTIVAINAWQDKNQDWSKPIFVVLYPVNADQSNTTQQYIQNLNVQQFSIISEYLQQKAVNYQQPIHIYFRLGQQVQILPPKVPETSSILSVMLWSLKFRYYAWQQQQDIDVHPDLTLFLNFYDLETHKILKHSTALQNGRIGIVNLFADSKQKQQNQIVIAHEMLHAFGATDKYDLSTGLPIYPEGYGNPQQQPLYPQQTAELMTGHIALTAEKSKMAETLQQVVINHQTAQEIGWIKP